MRSWRDGGRMLKSGSPEAGASIKEYNKKEKYCQIYKLKCAMIRTTTENSVYIPSKKKIEL